MEWEEVTDFEQIQYQKGYDEGTAVGHQQGYEEAFLFGLEHAYEKFLLIGEIYGRVCVWLQDENVRQPKVKKAKKHLEQLKTLLDALPFHNEHENTEAGFDAYWNRITAKTKVVSSLLGIRILPLDAEQDNDGFE
ncbi:CIA machinery involved in ribosome biogenesis protein Lto1 [Schizosaccharomyces osmophilus]|uniref:CIA machinery involved in ribosome biogenesis protein Lto1 n=1 Tax=Schizosaccharomyces osmophilus TaxID=2545709 RepID=A0AAE9WGA9_9SCHI|nr:CIA machinery involved in ribosome biogenesis protein Lto1 [Schizosaccharomyces osmophilus]WBW74682.1 CIA machinery involved in ribosome biogenesis protein Lto1 [Schizosaccharomyces osmophilus]